MSAYSLTMLTLHMSAFSLSTLRVCVVMDYSDICLLLISSQKQKNFKTAFACSYWAQVEFFLCQKSCETFPLSNSQLSTPPKQCLILKFCKSFIIQHY